MIGRVSKSRDRHLLKKRFQAHTGVNGQYAFAALNEGNAVRRCIYRKMIRSHVKHAAWMCADDNIAAVGIQCGVCEQGLIAIPITECHKIGVIINLQHYAYSRIPYIGRYWFLYTLK